MYIYIYLMDTNTYIKIYSINIITFTNPHPKPSRSFTARFLLEGHSLELEAAWEWRVYILGSFNR